MWDKEVADVDWFQVFNKYLAKLILFEIVQPTDVFSNWQLLALTFHHFWGKIGCFKNTVIRNHHRDYNKVFGQIWKSSIDV